jgi:O-antigen/teichoic acid export membrane protein
MRPDQKSIRDYLTITSGVLGRLVISLVYFLIVANVLSLGEFGIFASVSAVGLVLSRLLAFGFISPVYRMATVKPRLIGVYWGGLLVLAALSLPLVLAAAVGVQVYAFRGDLGLGLFLLIILAEVIGWRGLEYVVITLNGLSRFGSAATLVILGSALRTLAAVAFWLLPWRSLEAWILFYAIANGAALALGVIIFLPRMRLRLRLALYVRHMRDAVTTALSELVFYVQSEMDKVLVLMLAGPRTAGLYAIVMRLIDLTAIPVRSFNQLLVQRMMRDSATTETRARRIVIELAIAVVSTAGLIAFVVLLWLYPLALGRNVASAAPLLLPLLLVPALRNLVEYHGERLYAHKAFGTRLTLLIALAVLKLMLVAVLLRLAGDIEDWAWALNGVFALLYAISAWMTYRLKPVPSVQ